MGTGDLEWQVVAMMIIIALILFTPLPLKKYLPSKFHFRAQIAARIEKRDFTNRGHQITDDQNRSDNRLFPFPVTAITNLFLTGASLSVLYISPIDSVYLSEKLAGTVTIGSLIEAQIVISQAVWPFYIPIFAYFFLTFREHVSPLNRRRRKYDYALSMLVSAWVLQSFINASISGSPVPLLVQPAVCLAQILGVSAILARLSPTNKIPNRFARKLHALIKQVPPAVVALLMVVLTVPVVMVPFLVTRYRAVQWMEKCPILYLRSFSQEDAPRIFRRIVSRVCNRYGVVYALVHTRQTATKLRGDSAFYEGSQLAATPDEDWKHVVLEKLQSASAVIIDNSEDTVGISWEVAQARQLCDSKNIAILCKLESKKTSHPGIWHLEYEHGKSGYKKARRDLRDWLAPIMLGENST